MRSTLKKFVSKHIKYVFVYKPNTDLRLVKNSVNNSYYLCLLTDDNEVYFEKLAFRDFSPTLETIDKYAAHRFQKLGKLMMTYNFDRNTRIFLSALEKFSDHQDFLYQMFLLFSSFMDFEVYRRKFVEVMKIIQQFHGFDKNCFYRLRTNLHPWVKLGRLTKNVNICFNGLSKTRMCPWIGPEMDLFLARQPNTKAQIYKFCLMGLWFMVIRDYVREKHGIRISKWNKKIVVDMSDFNSFVEEIFENKRIQKDI